MAIASLILPVIEEPGVDIEQFVITEGAEPSTEAALPGLIIGVKHRQVGPVVLDEPYEGLLKVYTFPDFEIQSVVLNDASLKITLLNIVVRLNASANPDQGVITTSNDDIILSGTSGGFTIPNAGGFKGLTFGDNIVIRSSIVAAATGVVDIGTRTVMTDSVSATKFAGVIPGDILVFKGSAIYGAVSWKSTNSAAAVEYKITGVGALGVSITVDGTLEAGAGISYTIVRQITTAVSSDGSIDSAATQIKLSHDVPTGNAEFKITRTLVPGTISGNQPLASNFLLTSSNYTLLDGVDVGDSFSIPASLSITKFTTEAFTFPGTGTLVVGTNPKLLIVATQNLTTGDNPIVAGDTIYFLNTSNEVVGATVESIVFNTPNTEITLVETQATAVTAAVIRGTTKDGVGVAHPIVSADVQVEYKARSTKDHGRLMKIKTTSDLDDLGTYALYNELRVAGQIMKANAGTNAIYAIPVRDNSLESFADALEVAEGGLLYNIVPLTQSFSIQSAGKVHVDSMSTAIKAMWRTLWANLKRPLEGFIIPATSSGILTLTVTLSGVDPDVIIVDGSKVYLTDAQADFTGVFAGQYLKFRLQTGVANPLPQSGGTLVNSTSYVDSADTTIYFRIYKVKAVINKTKIELEPIPYQGSEGIYTALDTNDMVAETGISYTGKYEVINILTKDEIAQAIGTVAKGFSDRRVNYIPNSIARVAFVNSDGIQVIEDMPGYMATAALAGLSSNTEPHQPLTRVPLAGLAGIKEGRETYSSDQLSVMATGGCWILVQDELDVSPVYTWRQLTTSQGSLKEKEYSFTKNLDEISYALFFDLQRFPGRNNNVPKTIASIDAQIRATLEGRKTQEKKSITGGDLGPQIIKYTPQGTTPDPLLLDTVFNKITLTLPLPLNKIKVTLFA